MKSNIAKINFTTLFGALILFALPWTNVQCSGRNIAEQSGIQAVYGGMSLAPELKQMGEMSKEDGPDKTDMGMAYGLGIAALMVVAGTVLAGITLVSNKPPKVDPGLIAMSALILIVIQSVMGLPVDQSVAKSREEMTQKSKQVEMTNPDGTTAPAPNPEMANAMAESMGKAMGAMMQIRTKRTPWFYMELLLLAIPTCMIINQAINEKHKKNTDDETESVDEQQPLA